MKEFIIAMQFLTRLNIFKNQEVTEETFGRSLSYFPLVGFIVGGIMLLVAYLSAFCFNPYTTAVFIVIIEILVTGGLHLDGYMDTCDGIFSGRPRDRILEIMKDSRVGSMGVAALFVMLFLKIAFFTELPLREYWSIILLMPFVGRWAMVYVVTCYPYARPQGLGGIFHKQGNKKLFFIVSLYSLVIILLLLPYKLWIALLLTILSSRVVAKKISKILQGHTGDTYGAVCETTEIFFLFWCIVVYKLLIV